MRVPVSSMAVQMKQSVVPEAQGPLSMQTIQSQRKGNRNDRLTGWWLLFFLSRSKLLNQDNMIVDHKGSDDALVEIINYTFPLRNNS